MYLNKLQVRVSKVYVATLIFSKMSLTLPFSKLQIRFAPIQTLRANFQ